MRYKHLPWWLAQCFSLHLYDMAHVPEWKSCSGSETSSYSLNISNNNSHQTRPLQRQWPLRLCIYFTRLSVKKAHAFYGCAIYSSEVANKCSHLDGWKVYARGIPPYRKRLQVSRSGSGRRWRRLAYNHAVWVYNHNLKFIRRLSYSRRKTDKMDNYTSNSTIYPRF